MSFSAHNFTDLCPFWCLLGSCGNSTNVNNQQMIECLKGLHTNTLDELIHGDHVDCARNILNHFETALSTQNSHVTQHSNTNIVSNSDASTSTVDQAILLASVYRHLANLCVKEKKFRDADYYFEKATQKTPRDCELLLQHVKMIDQFIPNRRQTAQEIFKKIIKFEPNDPVYNFSYAMTLRESYNQLDKSILYFEKAIQLQPNNVRTAYEYAFALFKKGFSCFDAAIRMYETALQLASKNNFSTDNICVQMSTKMINQMKDCQIALKNSQSIDINTKQIRINGCARKINSWHETDRFHFPKPDNIAVAAVDQHLKPTDIAYKNLTNELIDSGYNDKILNQFKLQIYNYNIEYVKKYYKQDRFCHSLSILGYCTSVDSCQFIHCFSIAQLINDQNLSDINLVETVKQAILLINYLLYVYKNDTTFRDSNTEQYLQIMSALNARCGDVYRVIARNNNDFIIAERHYDRAFKLCAFFSSRNITHAKLLDQYLDNWDKSQAMYELSLVCEKANMAYLHFSYAMALMYRGCLDKAVAHFKEAIKWKGNHVRYHSEYGYCLFKKGPQYYNQSVKIFKHVLELNGESCNLVSSSARKRLAQINTYLKSNPQIINIQKDTDDITMDTFYKHRKGSIEHKLECVTRYHVACGIDKTQHRVSTGMEEKCNNTHANTDHTVNQANQLHIDKRQSQEFDIFWKNVDFGCIGVNKCKQDYYYNKFCEKQYNCLSIIKFIDKNILLNEIDMNERDCDYFLNKVKLFKNECKQFDQWLKHNDLYDLYIVKMNKYSIYTLKSLKNFISNNPNNWQTILKTKHTKDCWNIDAKLLKALLSNSIKV